MLKFILFGIGIVFVFVKKYMIPFIVGLGVVVYGISQLSDDEIKQTPMANCNKLFLDFEQKISLTASQKEKLKASREALQQKIRKSFSERDDVSLRGFYIQGSRSPKMLTTIIKKDFTYDVDLGVYLDKKPTVTCTTVQGYVYDAVKNHTVAGAEHRKKCIRVIFAGDFNIDLPVYYQNISDVHPFLAIKNENWRLDDPKEMCEWFKEKCRNSNGQLRRIVKYLKVWGDWKSFKMPSGIAMTVWAAKNYKKDERDDIALLKTLEEIKSSLFWEVSCIAQVVPNDNLVSNLTQEQKDKFRSALTDFISDAKKAIESDNQLKASKLWQAHLGDRFPDGKDEDVDKKEKELKAITELVNAGIAKTDKDGRIQTESGVENQRTRNYGGNLI